MSQEDKVPVARKLLESWKTDSSRLIDYGSYPKPLGGRALEPWMRGHAALHDRIAELEKRVAELEKQLFEHLSTPDEHSGERSHS